MIIEKSGIIDKREDDFEYICSSGQNGGRYLLVRLLFLQISLKRT